MSRNRTFNARFLLYFLFILVIVIVTSGKAMAADRPDSNIISVKLEDGKWTNNETSNVEINWSTSDPDNKKISRIYFWACYYENEDDCKGTGTDKNDWELIKNHDINPDKANATGINNIPLNDFLSKFDDKEGRYKVITCAVNADTIAEYGKEDRTLSNGCFWYKTDNHTTHFDSSKMKEFGFDQTAPEILIEIEQYSNGNDPETISYTITDLAGIKNFTLEYKFLEGGEWTEIYSKEWTGGRSEPYIGEYEFEYKDEVGCTGCDDGSYYLRINSTDILGHYSEAFNSSIYDTTLPVLEDFSITEDGDDKWLEVNDVVTIQWVSNEDIGSVEIKYCLWDDILSGNNTWSWVGSQINDGNTTNLTIQSSIAEGLYYFYPILTDLAGNPSTPEECKEDERLSLDKSKPLANLEPKINGKFAYNVNGTEIIISVSDNIELGEVVLWYSHESNLSNLIQNRSYNLSNKITHSVTETFNFPEGPGTYNFFLETDDQHPFTSATEATMTLIYDIEAPESEIVFEGVGLPSLGVDDLTNLENYPINCTTTDQDHEVDRVHLYFRYKERATHTFGNWSEEPTTIIYSITGICRIDFGSFTDGDGFYQFYTIAIDKAGNEEEKAEESEFTIIRDSVSPEFELLSLDSNAGEFLTFNFNTVYYKSENIGEGQYHINFTGSLMDSLTGINETSVDSEHEWDLDGSTLLIGYDFNTSKADEDQTITLTISDLAGNSAEISINFEEDNYAPTFTIYNSALKKSIHDETLLVKSNETTILITVFNNGSSISSYELRFDDSEWVNLNPNNPSFSIPNGKNSVSLRVADSLGNSISQNFTVEYDEEGPEFAPLNPNNNWYLDGNNTYVNGPFTMELLASDDSSGLDRIEFRYEDGEWQQYNEPLKLFEESDIWHMNFSYRGIDKLGNIKEQQVTFVIDNTTTLIDFSLLKFTLVSNSGDVSENRDWNGTEEIDYNLFSTLKVEIANISDEGGSGISKIVVEYSNDNGTWTKYDNMAGIELSSSSIQIRVTVTDNVGNTEEYVVGNSIEVINVPVQESPESESSLPMIALLIVVVLAGSAGAYKYRQSQLSDSEDDIDEKKKEASAIKCPKCSVLVPAESESCAFCGSQWDKAGNILLSGPFIGTKERIVKEVVPRTGEILIGPDLERWKIDAGARSSIGGRGNNEDSISWNSFLRATNDTPHSIRLGIVADGVGGHNKGEIASSLVISAINEYVSKAVNNPFHTKIFTPQEHLDILEKAYHYGNEIVSGKAQESEYGGMATTAVTVYLWEDSGDNNGFLIGNIGDSRGYLINSERIEQVTKDDSEVQKLIDAGEITESEAKNHPRKNVITQAIGNKKTIKPRIETYRLKDSEFDCILLCSDGVSDKISDKEIHKIVNQFDNPQDACNRIVKIINRTNTNHDNISLIVIKFPNLLTEG